MANNKIFRLHTDGTANSGWFDSEITGEHIEEIVTDGKEVATSIPSCYATMDLVKAAFAWVAKNGLEGDTAQHRLVSDALDIAQLFFNSPKFANKIDIIAWSPSDRLEAMKGNPKTNRLANVLELFWKGDVSYNLAEVQELYFIISKSTGKVVGSTSPASLFFAAPDARKALGGDNIEFGTNSFLGKLITPLHKREKAFVRYIYTLSKQRGFTAYFEELADYLEKVEEELFGEAKTEIVSIKADDIENYNPCLVMEQEGFQCEVLGIKLGVAKSNMDIIGVESGFTINPDVPVSANKFPLVLPQGKHTEGWAYTSADVKWDDNTKVPYRNTESISTSVLPLVGDKYPWLTEGNFLEDKIIKLPYSINGLKFYTCSDGKSQYLLPLSDTYFKYFSPSSIESNLKMTSLAGGGLEVKLRVPVKNGNFIEYKKLYSGTEQIVDLGIYLSVYPFVDTKGSFPLNYQIGLIKDGKAIELNTPLNLSVLKDGDISIANYSILRSVNHEGQGGRYYPMDIAPRIIQLEYNGYKGCIAPKLQEVASGSKVDFAIDFGTTNTHIEYRLNGNAAIPFSNEEPDAMWHSMLDRHDKENSKIHSAHEMYFSQDIMPYEYGGNKDVAYPLRTALVHNKNCSFANKPKHIGEVNNYLLFEKYPNGSYQQLKTDLKWTSAVGDEARNSVGVYIEYLLSQVLYKTMQLGCSPADATITWFYPVSMDEGEMNMLKEVWSKTYKKLWGVGDTKNIKAIPESIAPYLFCRAESGLSGTSMSIDIGGGSSDIAVFEDAGDCAKMISSVRFAGNSIFGDGYPGEMASSSDNNGFVRKYKDLANTHIESVQDVGKRDDLQIILNQILNDKKDSSDFASFLFSLKNGEDGFDFADKLYTDKRMKLPIVIFFGALAYYSANLLKKGGVNVPRHVLFSGTASKTISIIDKSEKHENVAAIFKSIFSDVYGENIEHMNVMMQDNPKELTCKGALKIGFGADLGNAPVKYWIGGVDDSNVFGSVLDRDREVEKKPAFGNIETTQKENVEKSIKDFYTKLDKYVGSVNFESKYILDADVYEVFKALRTEIDLKDELSFAIQAYNKAENLKIDESLFFYPLIGVLNKLANKLSEA